MIDFLQKLKLRYTSVLESAHLDAEQQAEMQSRLNALRLAESVLRKVALNESQPDHTLQIGILGPTQAGKSTLVNLLLKISDAGVSPLAGYTVHAQGFALPGENGIRNIVSPDYLEHLLPDFEQTPRQSLDHNNYKQYSFEQLDDNQMTRSAMTGSAMAQSAMMGNLVLWDSPDFDSIESRGYRSAVLRVAALSDIIIMMLSKDKYADKSVWDMMSLLRPLNKPLLVCINKLNPDDRDVVVGSFNDRLNENSLPTNQKDGGLGGSDAKMPTIITLPYSRGLDDAGTQFDPEVTGKLDQAVNTVLKQVSRPDQRNGGQAFIRQHWDSWLEPVVAEQEAAAEWELAVSRAIDEGLAEYKTNFLDHPQKFDTFNKAIAELLTLLEIPGLAAPLMATRKIVTWPMRKLLGVGQALTGIGDDGKSKDSDLEEDALVTVFEHAVSKLNNMTLDMSENNSRQHQWWLSLNKQIRTREPMLKESFGQSVEDYQRNFKPEIDKAAQTLYKQLQQQPVVLNGLRAARVSTDAAAVVLAVKSGGLAASDLVLAPAILSLTSMLTEGAIGKYMETVKTDLKNRQYATVESDVLRRTLELNLLDLSGAMTNNALFAIDKTTLDLAQQELASWNTTLATKGDNQ